MQQKRQGQSGFRVRRPAVGRGSRKLDEFKSPGAKMQVQMHFLHLHYRIESLRDNFSEMPRLRKKTPPPMTSKYKEKRGSFDIHKTSPPVLPSGSPERAVSPEERKKHLDRNKVRVVDLDGHHSFLFFDACLASCGSENAVKCRSVGNYVQ